MTLRMSLKKAMLLALFAVSGTAGCKLFDSTCTANDRSCLGGGELRSGQACIRTGDCALGLSCVKNICTYQGTSRRGDTCVTSNECAKDLYCSTVDLQCHQLNDDAKAEGGACDSTADCEHGLVCDLDVVKLFNEGFFSQIPPECLEKQNSDDTPEQCTTPRRCTSRGTTDLGSKCKTSADCLAGLFCIPNPLNIDENICFGGQKLGVEAVSVPLWGGFQCPSDVKTSVAYFDVPRKGVKEQDFYRLPFPNDIRSTDSGIDLSTHPGPPPDLEPLAAHRYLEAAATVHGFATNPMVLFRFSQKIRNQDRSGDTLMIIDITKSSRDYGHKASVAWLTPDVHSNYICAQWLAVHPTFDAPLRSNTTYAAIVTKGVHTAKGENFARSLDFEAMLKGDRPSQNDVADAWDKYAPLRAYLADAAASVSASDVLNAAVFTTQDATGIIPKLRAAVEHNGPAALKDLMECDGSKKSPCEDSSGRGACQTKHNNFVEIHGHVMLPGFQSGTPPFMTPADGGDIALDGSGNPVVKSQPPVCFALSIPNTPAPDSGYPLLLVAHGTGGSFTDQMRPGQLAEFAASVNSAVLAIDMPMHGNRRNSDKPPQDLFFNFMNPLAARGNTLQGSADLMGVALLASKTIEDGDSPTGKAIKFDASRVVLYAHSQGATHASLMIGSEPRVRAALLTGVGGHFANSLLLKKKPIDMASVLPFVLFDPSIDDGGKLVGGEVNPMLALLQTYFESADPLNYARQLYLEIPESAASGHDIFMVYGLFDSFTPEGVQQNYAKAAGLSAVERDLTEVFMELPSPTKGNVTIGGTQRTVALRTYDPMDDGIMGIVPDGHFVASLTMRGVADVRRFLTQALQGKTPEIGQ